MPADVRGYQIDVELKRDRITLELAGDLDAAAIARLRDLMPVIARVPVVVHVYADAVLGSDLEAFDPLLEVARRRRAQGLPAVRVDALSDAVRDLFAVLGLPARPPVVLGEPGVVVPIARRSGRAD
jgi:ABC-type transporter Mla MlaB component